VSRSFYLTLRVLPAEIRPQISLAYLLARASDTIADTKAVPKRERIEVLRQFAAGTRLKLAVTDGSPAEQRLLARLDDCFAMLASLSNEDQRLIRALHQTIVSGQIFDLEKFPREHGTELVALANDKELDRYTYLVAGCVGEFWTKMCRTHLPGLEALSIDDGVRFGKGLQLVNILRDLPKDLRIGRCYLPMSEPALLIEPNNFTTVEHIYRQWLDIAVEHLDAGWRYTLAIPANQRRLRLACVWPIWIGLKTIARLRRANPLDTSQRVKVSRPEVYWIMLESALLVGNDAALDEVYQRLRLKTGR
jgi:farnesyl-diphosphate farnesyltransferase